MAGLEEGRRAIGGPEKRSGGIGGVIGAGPLGTFERGRDSVDPPAGQLDTLPPGPERPAADCPGLPVSI